ncbi:hypothetical protein EV383_2867 [Pseudonocardia sediminis]|uniref:DUF4190 domain-containing protein n=1 Tax=Pseudonocardia sediminis TaxID=1397368 RepID=A0A4Q7V0H0_PSEST|nr:hypothetical protein [Pseudonocardia sediminis]RZT85979.1 hypothetical protein EV383_2867 [Pseudonocardia sediminis]
MGTREDPGAERQALTGVVVGAVAIVGAVVLAVLGWAGGAVAVILGQVARRRGAGSRATTAVVLGAVAIVLGMANAVFGAYLFSR